MEICCFFGWGLFGRSRVRAIRLFSRFLLTNLMRSLCHLKVRWLVAVSSHVLGLSPHGGFATWIYSSWALLFVLFVFSTHLLGFACNILFIE